MHGIGASLDDFHLTAIASSVTHPNYKHLVLDISMTKKVILVLN